MRYWKILWIGFSVLLSLSIQAQESVDLFTDLLAEAQLKWTAPKDFKPTPIKDNALLPYEQALLNKDGSLEIRYAVRPLKRLEIEYNDPHNAAPEPNHIFPLLFDTLTGNLSGGRHSPSREYPPDQTKKYFNADWAAASVFDVLPDFKTDHSQVLLIALHKNAVADAYVLYLFNDYSQVKAVINTHLSTLQFR